MNPYVDPATGVHYNKLGIKDREVLLEAEYNATWVRGIELRASPILGQFDLAHLKAVHKALFQDVYDWAGEQRSVNFSKKDAGEPWWKTRFDSVDLIGPRIQATADYLRDNNFLRGLPREEFAGQVAKVYVQLNMAHPFPEGNGRSTQTFLSQLATEAGHRLDFQLVDRKTWLTAAARSMPQEHIREPGMRRPGSSQLIEEVFQKIVVPQREQTQSADHQAGVDRRVAAAFVTLPRDEATKLYPELAPGFDRLEAVAMKLTQEGKPATYVADFLQAVREQLGRHLQAGQRLDIGHDDRERLRGAGLER